jgi:hypothetical protein
MATTAEYRERFISIMGEYLDKEGSIVINFSSSTEATEHLKKLRLKQKELRLLKTEINTTMKSIRYSYSTQKAQVDSKVVKLFFGKKAAGSSNAQKKAYLRDQQNKTLAPYEALKTYIDQTLISLEKLKIQLEQLRE